MLQRLAGNAAVSRLVIPGALGPLGQLVSATPATFGQQATTVAGTVPAALAGERDSAALPAPAPPTGLPPGEAVAPPPGPRVDTPAPSTPAAAADGGQLGDPSAADRYASSGTSAVNQAASQATGQLPKLGASLNPTVAPAALPPVDLPPASMGVAALGAGSGGAAPSRAEEAAALDAAAGPAVHRLLGQAIGPAGGAAAAHAAEVARARTAAGSQVNGIRSDAQTRQEAVRTSADAEAQDADAHWAVRRQELVAEHASAIQSSAGQARSAIRETAQTAESEAAAKRSATGSGDKASEPSAWDRVKQGASAAVGAVKDVASSVASAVAGVFAAARAKIGGLLGRLAEAVRQRVSAAISALRAGAARAWDLMRAAYRRAQDTITRLARAALDAAKRLWSAVAASLAKSWQRLLTAARSALAAAADIGRKITAALTKVQEILKMLGSPLVKFLTDLARDFKKTVVDPLLAKAAPYIGRVPGMAKNLAQQTAQPTIPLQRQPSGSGQPAVGFAATVDKQMSKDTTELKSHWFATLSEVIGNVLWPKYLFTEELPALVEECKGIYSPAPGLDRLDHLLGVVRRLTNIINGTLATLGVWAAMLAILGGPVAEFFTVGTYYAVSLVMIEVDVATAIVQLVKYAISGSRAGISQADQSRYARMYSATGIGAILSAALLVIGIIATRFAARFKAMLPKEPVKPPVEEKPITPVEDKPLVTPPVTGRPNWNGKPCPADFSNYSGFHGSDTPPETVKTNGFGGGKNADLKAHMQGNSAGDDAFMGTTSAAGGGHEGGGSSAWGTYVYQIDGVEAWDCNRQWFMNEGAEAPTRGETEIAVQRAVPWEKIKGWYEPKEHFSGRQVLGPFTPNPDYGKVPVKK